MKPKTFVCSVLLAFAFASHPATSATLHVWQESPNPSPPYNNWKQAAHVIQDAVNQAKHGDTVLVANGVYSSGGRAVVGLMTNRVAIDRTITLMSINGPEVTVIEGAEAPGGSWGDGAIRSVYLGDNAVLSGFTLRRGHTRASGDWIAEQNGGGVICSDSSVVSNCVFIGCSAFDHGGGAYGGTLRDCTFKDCLAGWSGGGTYGSTAYDCLFEGCSSQFGGGAFGGSLYRCILRSNEVVTGISSFSAGGGSCRADLYNCVLVGNKSEFQGGGAKEGALFDCLVVTNSAYVGGGAYECFLFNCTLVGNSAVSGGGVLWGTVLNSILYFNTAQFGPNHNPSGLSIIRYSCTTPLPDGIGNIDTHPFFLNATAGDFHLGSGSPCIDAGTDLNHLTTTDLDGNPRPLDGDGDGIAAFDMGAYELVMEFEPCEAVEQLIRKVVESNLDRNRKQPLFASLVAACASFEGNRVDAGINQLRAFENKVRAQVARVDDQLADELINAAQEIIDEVTKSAQWPAQRANPRAEGTKWPN